MRTLHSLTHDRVTRLATAYDDASTDETDGAEEAGEELSTEENEVFSIPEDLSALSHDELTGLHSEAVSHFNSLYGEGDSLSDDDLEVLGTLTEGIETLSGEITQRSEKAEERKAKADELASKVQSEHATVTVESSEEEDVAVREVDAETGEDKNKAEGEKSEKDITASAAETVDKRKPVSVNLSRVKSKAKHQPSPVQSGNATRGMKDLVASGETGEGIDWNGLAQSVDRKLGSFPQNHYQVANRRGQNMREQHSLAVIQKPYEEDQLVASADPDHIQSVMNRAVDQSRLPQGSLTAAGGWCAPSDTLYDFLELESRDGLLSVPEMGITRGGIQFTQGPSFADLYSQVGFSFTETEAEAGDYDGEGGTKPFYKIECPEFTDKRLKIDGLYLTAGLLQQRGYPEVISRTLRGALVAHDHKMSGNSIASMATDSTDVSMPADQAGAAAPILNTVELQVEHYRTVHRLSMNTTLEAIFPAWTRGVIKTDLARREGIDHLSVTNAQVDAWFRQRGVAAQFVYNWQSIDDQTAANFVAWPSELKFLLYAAGTWVRGTSDIITLDTIYDSVNLGQNDYIALFSEEGWLMAKRGHDSRNVTVPLNASGTYGDAAQIAHDGTLVVADGGTAA